MKSAHGVARKLGTEQGEMNALHKNRIAIRAATRREARAAKLPFKSRKRKRASSSRAAPDRQRSGRGNRRRQGHDGACDILLFRRSPELIKTFGTSHLKQVMQQAALGLPGWCQAPSRDQARDSTPSNAWAMKMPAPTRPITAVTISNIANILCAPREQNDAQGRTVKRISWKVHTMGPKCGFRATYVPKPSTFRSWRGAIATFHSPMQSAPHFCHGLLAVSLQLGAESGDRIGAYLPGFASIGRRRAEW